MKGNASLQFTVLLILKPCTRILHGRRLLEYRNSAGIWSLGSCRVSTVPPVHKPLQITARLRTKTCGRWTKTLTVPSIGNIGSSTMGTYA